MSVELKRSKNHGTRDLYQKVNDFAYSYSEIQSIDRWPREKSWYYTTSPLISSRNDLQETSAEIPYWWRVTTQICVVLFIGWKTSGDVTKCRLFHQATSFWYEDRSWWLKRIIMSDSPSRNWAFSEFEVKQPDGFIRVIMFPVNSQLTPASLLWQ